MNMLRIALFGLFLCSVSSCATEELLIVNGEVTDIEGTTYPTVTIGTQIWMASNLKTGSYSNGEAIPNIVDNFDWRNLSYGSWSSYEHNISNEDIFGKLYNWYAVTDSRNLCPTGWHVPTNEEWTTLREYLGANTIAGGKMKSTGTAYWNSPNGEATNESGFSGLPGGIRIVAGDFIFFGIQGHWWCANESGPNNGIERKLNSDNGDLDTYSPGKNSGLSVRCIQD